MGLIINKHIALITNNIQKAKQDKCLEKIKKIASIF